MTHSETLNADASLLAQMQTRTGAFEGAKAEGRYVATCYEPRNVSAYNTFKAELEQLAKAGDVIRAAKCATAMQEMLEVAWHEEYDNLVVTSGKNLALNTLFMGSSYTAAWYLGLVNGATTPTFAATDTMASHSGWTEYTGYSSPTARATPTWTASTADSIVTNGMSFTMNATGTVAGSFMTTNSTISGTTGTLYSAGAFTGGNQSVTSTSTLTVTWTGTV